MYKNVNAEFARGDITLDIASKKLNRSPSAVSLILSGKTLLKFGDAVLIQELIEETNGVHIPLKELFKEAI